jgi:signal transduction histidine kinase
MSSGSPERATTRLGLTVASWYAAIFVGSSLALIVVTYILLSVSLHESDREVIGSTLRRYAAAYEAGGADGLIDAVNQDESVPGHESLLVRAVTRFENIAYVSPQTDWRRYDLSRLPPPRRDGYPTWGTIGGEGQGELLDVGSMRLRDGALLQVGRSTSHRRSLLTRFRYILLIEFAALAIIALAGGAVFTASALRPLRDLNQTVREIMRTGQVQARVPARNTGDALDELGAEVNGMLDRIEGLIAGMRAALDNVAHDLRTPMMRLRGIAETALESGDDPKALRDALADCLEESERVVAMLNTLMDISEAETGTMRLNRERVNLTGLVREAVEIYEDAAEEKRVTVTLEDSAAGDLWVDVDRIRMRQVLANLLDNALKYTPPGGSVAVAARLAGGDVQLSVSDTGVGIPPEELPRIWERLYRGDKSRSERGLGLGLSVVKAIVEAHGGRVTVQSAPDRGSRFVLHLTAAGPPPAA